MENHIPTSFKTLQTMNPFYQRGDRNIHLSVSDLNSLLDGMTHRIQEGISQGMANSMNTSMAVLSMAQMPFNQSSHRDLPMVNDTPQSPHGSIISVSSEEDVTYRQSIVFQRCIEGKKSIYNLIGP